jgi:hypothetical protein
VYDSFALVKIRVSDQALDSLPFTTLGSSEIGYLLLTLEKAEEYLCSSSCNFYGNRKALLGLSLF